MSDKMKESYKGNMISGDSKINADHHKNASTMSVEVDKRDVAQIYVVKIKQQVKADLKKQKGEREKLKTESVELVNQIESLINSTVEQNFKGKVDKVNETYKDLKAAIKKLVKAASGEVDTALESLFEDMEEIDSRIKTTVTTPNISYSWRAVKAFKDDGSGEEEVLRVSLVIDGHTEKKDIPVPSKIASLKQDHKNLEVLISEFDLRIKDLSDKLNSTADLQEAAEAAVAMAKLEQSDFGKDCLNKLASLSDTGQLLLGTDTSEE